MSADLSEVHVANASPFDLGIVHNDDITVPRVVRIQFDPIRTHLDGTSKRGERILEFVGGGAPVGDDDRQDR